MKGSIDRDEVLRRIDLAELADEVAGPRKGQGTGARWPSPVPGHEQTGKSPPMSIFTARGGTDMWTCFATGESGTAIDLLMIARRMGFREALGELAQRVGMEPGTPTRFTPAPTRRKPQLVRLDPDPELGKWVEGCAAHLHTDDAADAREWLIKRGVPEESWEPNMIGWDPGESYLWRADGLPADRGTVVLPVRNEEADVVYAQARDLSGRRRYKYRNPSAKIAPHPHVGFQLSEDRADKPLLVTEGVLDGLMANAAGFDSVALLGVGVMKIDEVASRIGEAAGDRPVVLALDKDVPAVDLSEAKQRLSGVGVSDVRIVKPGDDDLTVWWQRQPKTFSRDLERAIEESASLSL